MKLQILGLLVLVSQLCFGQSTPKNYSVKLGRSVKIEYSALASDSLYFQGKYVSSYYGHKQKEGSYLNNQRHGDWVFSAVEGQKIVAHYDKGNREGKWQFFNSGKLVNELVYYNDTIDTIRIYHDNGRLAHLDDKINGNCFYYNKKGVLLREGVKDKNGLVHNRIFDPKGEVLLYVVYKDNLPYSIEKVTPNVYWHGGKVSGDLKNGNGKYILQSLKEENNQPRFYFEMNFKNGLPDGVYSDLGNFGEDKCAGQFEKGFLVGNWSSEITQNNTKSTKHKSFVLADSIKKDSLYHGDRQFEVVESLPEFPNGINGLLQYLSKSLIYPRSAMELGLQETIVLRFIIGRAGEVRDITVVKGTNQAIIDEAMRVVKEMPLWVPGKQQGIPVAVAYTLPIRFTLQ